MKHPPSAGEKTGAKRGKAHSLVPLIVSPHKTHQCLISEMFSASDFWLETESLVPRATNDASKPRWLTEIRVDVTAG